MAVLMIEEILFCFECLWTERTWKDFLIGVLTLVAYEITSIEERFTADATREFEVA